MISSIPSLTESSSPVQKKQLSNLGTSIISSAMQSLQTSKYNSKYVRYQSPSINSFHGSPTFLKLSESKVNEKKIFKTKEYFQQSELKRQVEERLCNTFIPVHEKLLDSDVIGLEVKGTCRVLESLDPKHRRIKTNFEIRKMNISLLEDKKKELYYDRYRAKLREAERLRDLRFKARINDLQKLKTRYKNDNLYCADSSVETCEISLQTPPFFNQ